jgi:signal transduction histidine kinase
VRTTTRPSPGGEIFLHDEASGDLVLAMRRGEFAEPFHRARRLRPGEGLVGRAVQSNSPVIVHDLTRTEHHLRPEVVAAGFRALACLPLLADDRPVDVLALIFRDPAVFETFNNDLLGAVTRQVGIAVEHARLHEQVGRLAVLEDRQRIAMDMHDGVIQSIYAVGLQLEVAEALVGDGDSEGAGGHLRGALDQLRTVIGDIRAYIRDLRPEGFQGNSLAAELERLVADFTAATRVACSLIADKDADAALTAAARLALLQIAREALSNAVRHGRATQVHVHLGNTGPDLLLMVRDNGLGFDPARARSGGYGLRNMRERAEALGGGLEILPAPESGTELRVTVPVTHPA